MKVNFLHIIYSGLGGTTDYVFNLIKGDKNASANHYILFFGIETVESETLIEAKDLCSGTYTIIKKTGFDKKAIITISNILKERNFNIITLHVNSLIAHLPKILPKDCQLFFVEHQANHLKRKKEWLWSVLAQRNANKIISLTTNYQEELKKKLKFLYKKKKNIIIRTGIEISDYKKGPEATDTIKFGMISRINDLKDHRTLIAAFSQLELPNIELHIAGDGPLFSQLKKNSNSYSNIYFHGQLSKQAIRSFLTDINIYVQATKGETSSIAIMQAQCAELPIVASNVKGINNVLNSTNAILVEPESISDMEQALLLMINNTQLRSGLSNQSGTYARQNLSNKRMFKDYYKLIAS